MANKQNGTIYVGVTSNLIKRIYEHRNQLCPGFTKEYGLNKLVYYEVYDEIMPAIEREKQLKKWNREWKIDLIEKENPNWDDLYESII